MNGITTLNEEDLNPTQPPAVNTTVPPAAPPPPTPAAPPPQPTPPPTTTLESSTSQTQTGSSTTREVASPEEKKALGELQDITEKRVGLEERAFQLKQEEIKAAQAKAEAEVNAQVAYEAERAKKQQEFDAKLNEKSQNIAESVKAVQNFQFKDFFQDKGLASKAMAAIAVGLGQYGAALTGGQNTAYQILKDSIDMDFSKQQANLSKLKDAVVAAKGERADLLDEYSRATSVLDASKAIAYEKAAKLYEQQLLKQGIPAAEVAKNIHVLGLNREAANQRLETAKGLRTKVTESISKGVSTTEKEVDLPTKAKTTSEVGLAEDKRIKEVQEVLNANKDFTRYRAASDGLSQFKNLREAGADGAAITQYIAKVLEQGSFDTEMSKFIENNKGLSALEENLNKLGTGSAASKKLLGQLEMAMKADLVRAKTKAEGIISYAKKRGEELQDLTGSKDFFFKPEETTPSQTSAPRPTAPKTGTTPATPTAPATPSSPKVQDKWGEFAL